MTPDGCTETSALARRRSHRLRRQTKHIDDILANLEQAFDAIQEG